MLVLILLLFLTLVTIRTPLAIAIGTITAIYMWYTGSLPLIAMPLDAFQSLDRFPLLAVPMFILAGQLMATGGVAQRILTLADVMVGDIKGAYAIITILSCVFFGGLSGSAPATAAAIGAIMIPAMKKHGYDPGFAAGVTACAGVLGIIIPPSNPMIIYALAGNASVSKLFLGGIVPGFLLAAGIGLPAWYIARRNDWGGNKKRGSFRDVLKSAWYAKWALLTPVIILGGIYSGIFTPTESAAIASLYAFCIGLLVHRDFSVREIPKILRSAALPVATVMLLVTFSTALGNALTIEGIPGAFADAIGNMTESPLLTLLLINVLLLCVGCFMDTLAAIIILTPLLLPIAQNLGLDETHFGIIMVVNLGIGFVTPPFGSNLFIANQLSDTPIQSVFRGALPLILGMIVSLLLITLMPFFSTVIPNFFY